MEQMYLIEIFIDKVTIYVRDEESSANKNLIVKIKFGPNVQFIVKEGQLAVNERADDIIVTDEISGLRYYSRTIRVGKSYLFPSFPDTILLILSKFPLEIEVWDDDTTNPEGPIFVGVGIMPWHTHFFHMVKETADPCKLHQPLSIKNRTTIMAECCCVKAGEVDFIFRLSALGGTIITEFQQLLKDPDAFVLRTNKAPSMFQCRRVEGDDPNFCMVGSLYETTTLEDPDIVDKANKMIEVCTELQSCGMGGKAGEFVCDHPAEASAKKKYAIDKIRMGDIIGPCGNTNCELAHRVRKYIRNLDTYKNKGLTIDKTKPENERKVCGKCVCKDDRFHRESCPKDVPIKTPCTGCQGMTASGNTCEDKLNKEYGTGATPIQTPNRTPKSTPKPSEMRVGYVFNLTQFPDYKQGMFGHDTIVENCFCSKMNMSEKEHADLTPYTSTSEDMLSSSKVGCGSCTSRSDKFVTKSHGSRSTTNTGIHTPMIYNLDYSSSNTPQRNIFYGSSYRETSTSAGTSTANQEHNMQVYNVTITEDKDCRCTPKKPSPPCKTFDCDCLTENLNIRARKLHKPYCPSYKHKSNCPVTMMNEEEDPQKKLDEDEEEVAPLPYGLPPIQLGPCPVLGRPCSVPDGFAKMYKNALVPTLPFSYSDDGKVCCSKEYERIKKAIREYMKNDKESDYRCVNTFNIDTERRCCDKEQVLRSLVGKACCGSHKLSIQEKFKIEEKRPPC